MTPPPALPRWADVGLIPLINVLAALVGKLYARHLQVVEQVLRRRAAAILAGR